MNEEIRKIAAQCAFDVANYSYETEPVDIIESAIHEALAGERATVTERRVSERRNLLRSDCVARYPEPRRKDRRTAAAPVLQSCEQRDYPGGPIYRFTHSTGTSGSTAAVSGERVNTSNKTED